MMTATMHPRCTRNRYIPLPKFVKPATQQGSQLELLATMGPAEIALIPQDHPLWKCARSKGVSASGVGELLGFYQERVAQVSRG